MSTSGFEARLADRLTAYAEVAAAAATPAEIEAAVAARRAIDANPYPLRRVVLSRRLWLVAAALALAAVLAIVAAGLLRQHRPVPHLVSDLTLVASSIDNGGIRIWDTDSGAWSKATSGGPRRLSPNGRWLAYTSPASGYQGRLYVRDLANDQSEPISVWGKLITRDGASFEGQVSWSPDSRYLLRFTLDGHIDVFDVQSPTEPFVTYPGFSDTIASFAWAPERAGVVGRLAVASAEGAIETIDLGAPHPIDVAQRPAFASDPDLEPGPEIAWSPDGTRLAVLGIDGNLYTIDPTQRAITPLTSDGSLAQKTLWGWSADGASIGVGQRIFEPASGTQGSLPWTEPIGCSSSPAWSTTGHDVAQLSDGRLHVLRVDGTAHESADIGCPPSGTATRTLPLWSPDDSQVVVEVIPEDAGHWPLGLRAYLFDVTVDTWTVIASEDRSGINYLIGWRTP